MTKKFRAPKIEDDVEFKKLVYELDVIEFFTDLEKLNQTDKIQKLERIKEIKHALYEKLKTGIESNPLKETDLFNDPVYLERLTAFSQVNQDNIKERKNLVKKYSSYLNTQKRKSKPPLGLWGFFFANRLSNPPKMVADIFGLIWIIAGIVLPIATIGTVYFFITIPLMILPLVYYASDIKNSFNKEKSRQNQMLETSRKAWEFEKFAQAFEQRIKNILITHPVVQPELDPTQKPVVQNDLARKKAIKHIADFILERGWTDKKGWCNNRSLMVNIAAFFQSRDLQDVAFDDFKKALMDQLNFKIEISEVNNKKGHFYSFELDEAQIQQIKDFINPPDEQKNLLGEEYFIKSIRADGSDYFSTSFVKMVTKSEGQYDKYPLRTEENEGLYRVNGVWPHKIEPKDDNNPSEKYQGERPFSQYQSTTLSFDSQPQPLFSHAKDDCLSAIAVKKEDVWLSDRLCKYDRGTVNRPNHFNSKAKAKDYFANEVRIEDEFKNIYSEEEYEEFVKAVLAMDGKNYNEVLAGMRWNSEDNSSCLLIGKDDLGTRILTQHRAKILRERLKKQAVENENGKPFDENYIVPMVYYKPNDPKHLTPYDVFQQREDIEMARRIIKNDDLIDRFRQQGAFVFLLALDADKLDSVFIKFSNDDYNITKNLIQKKRLSILMPLLSKLKKETLKKIIHDSGNDLIKLMLSHKHYNYPEFIDVLFEHQFHQDSDPEIQKAVFKLALSQHKIDEKTIQNFDPKLILDWAFELADEYGKVNKWKDTKFAKIFSAFMNLSVVGEQLAKKDSPLSFVGNEHQIFLGLLNQDEFNKLSVHDYILSLLEFAIKNNAIDLVQKLLREKIIPNKIQVDFTKMLELGRKHRSWECLRCLIENKNIWSEQKINLAPTPILILFGNLVDCRLPSFPVLEFLLDKTNFVDFDAPKLIKFLIEQGKYKLFMKVINMCDKHHIKSVMNGLEKKEIARCPNLKIRTFIEFSHFILKIKEYASSPSKQISFSTLKYLEDDARKFLMDNLLDKNYDYKEELNWALAKIKNPDHKIIYGIQICDKRIKMLDLILNMTDASQQHKIFLKKQILKNGYATNPYQYFTHIIGKENSPKPVMPVIRPTVGWTR